MQKELDKIERFAGKIVKQSNLPKAAAERLHREAKVCSYCSLMFVFMALQVVLQEFTELYREKLSKLNVKGAEMNDNYREILVRYW
jgi:hypothetical protein